jgi:hypothetical protein
MRYALVVSVKMVIVAAYIALLLLSVSMLGQSSVHADTPKPYTMGRHWITHEGRNIEVYGYMRSDGKVVWTPGIAENARPRERRTKTVDGPSERIPTAEIKVEPEPTAKPPSPAPDWRTNGVSRPAAPAPTERYTAHSDEAKQFVAEAADKPSDKLHVTIIGNADERARVTNDIKTDPAFEGLRDGLWVQDYDVKDWPVNPSLGFLPGKPAIIVQAPKGPNDPKGGRVIYRTLDYSIGAKGLAEALRKANPDYKPDRDPGPHKPEPTPLPNMPDLAKLDAPTYVIVGGLLLLLLLPKKGK